MRDGRSLPLLPFGHFEPSGAGGVSPVSPAFLWNSECFAVFLCTALHSMWSPVALCGPGWSALFPVCGESHCNNGDGEVCKDHVAHLVT